MKIDLLGNYLKSLRILDHPVYGYEFRDVVQPRSSLAREFNQYLDDFMEEPSKKPLLMMREEAIRAEKTHHYIHPKPIAGHRVRNKDDFYDCLKEGRILSRNDLEREKPNQGNFFTYNFDRILDLSRMIFFGIGAGFFDNAGNQHGFVYEVERFPDIGTEASFVKEDLINFSWCFMDFVLKHSKDADKLLQKWLKDGQGFTEGEYHPTKKEVKQKMLRQLRKSPMPLDVPLHMSKLGIFPYYVEFIDDYLAACSDKDEVNQKFIREFVEPQTIRDPKVFVPYINKVYDDLLITTLLTPFARCSIYAMELRSSSPFPVFNPALAGFVIGSREEIPEFVRELRNCRDISDLLGKKVMFCESTLQAVDLEDCVKGL